MAVLLNGLGPRELATWTAAMIDSGERLDLSRPVAPDGRQALDRRRRRQGVARSSPRSSRPAAPRSPSSPVAGLGHTGGTLDKLESIPGWRATLSQRRDPRPARVGRLRDLRGRRRARARGPQALRAARRDRDRRVDPAHLRVDHVEEDRRGHGVARARREGRHRGVHEGPGDRAAELARTMVGLGADHGVATVALLTAMDTPLGRACRQRARGRRGASRCCAAAGPRTSSR